MARTPGFGLMTFNRALLSRTTNVGDLLDGLCGENNSNMIILDAALTEIKRGINAVTDTITGDGVKNSFIVVHGKNNEAVSVSVFDIATNAKIFPEIQVLDLNRITIKFLFPLPENKSYRVVFV
jgi:hypothetical protein